MSATKSPIGAFARCVTGVRKAKRRSKEDHPAVFNVSTQSLDPDAVSFDFAQVDSDLPKAKRLPLQDAIVSSQPIMFQDWMDKLVGSKAGKSDKFIGALIVWSIDWLIDWHGIDMWRIYIYNFCGSFSGLSNHSSILEDAAMNPEPEELYFTALTGSVPEGRTGSALSVHSPSPTPSAILRDEMDFHTEILSFPADPVVHVPKSLVKSARHVHAVDYSAGTVLNVPAEQGVVEGNGMAVIPAPCPPPSTIKLPEISNVEQQVFHFTPKVSEDITEQNGVIFQMFYANFTRVWWINQPNRTLPYDYCTILHSIEELIEMSSSNFALNQSINQSKTWFCIQSINW